MKYFHVAVVSKCGTVMSERAQRLMTCMIINRETREHIMFYEETTVRESIKRLESS